MNIQFGHPRIGNFQEEFYAHLKKAFPEHNSLFPHEEGKDTPNSRETLKEQDIFLCDISHAATGLGIEMGFAALYGVRIICMYKAGLKISGSLRYVADEIFEYEGEADMIKK